MARKNKQKSMNLNCAYNKHFIISEDGLRVCVVCGIDEELIAEEFEVVVSLLTKGFKLV
jgi:hypothetical protein